MEAVEWMKVYLKKTLVSARSRRLKRPPIPPKVDRWMEVRLVLISGDTDLYSDLLTAKIPVNRTGIFFRK